MSSTNALHFRFYFILAGIWRRRYTIIIPIIVLPFFAVMLSSITPKNYASHTSMLIQETAKLNPFLEDLHLYINFVFLVGNIIISV